MHLPSLGLGYSMKSQQSKRFRFSAPKFYSVPHNRVCEEGETVRFQCAIAGHPTPWSTWDKDGIIVTPSSRISIKERDDLRFLEIEEVCMEDAGLYRITLENDYGRIEATARLDIIRNRKSSARGVRATSAPSRRSRSVSRRIMGYSTKIGGRLVLATQVRSSSIPSNKKVYHNGYEINDNDRLKITELNNEVLLEIDNATPTDGGEYTLLFEHEDILFTTTTIAKVCENDEENSQNHIPPKIKKGLPERVLSGEGLPLDLTFVVDCKDPFDYVWMRDDEVVFNSEDFS